MNTNSRGIELTFITRCQYALWTLLAVATLAVVRLPIQRAVAQSTQPAATVATAEAPTPKPDTDAQAAQSATPQPVER
ncbi:MAG: hypothetical protein KDA92_03205, partial [Planctomycetales bacterium]|nr:hypothetical protein [Planctomycetales bacterium]